MTAAIVLGVALVGLAGGWMFAALRVRVLRAQRYALELALADQIGAAVQARWLLIAHDIDPDTGEAYGWAGTDMERDAPSVPLTDNEWDTSVDLIREAFNKENN